MRSLRITYLLLAWLAVQGCICDNPVDDPDSKVPGQCLAEKPVPEPQRLDILFVVDNSGSMKEEQEGVARELTAFIEEVKKGGGVAQDFNVGVITTSVYQHTLVNGVRGYREYPGQAGRLQPVPDRSGDGGVVLGTGTEKMLSGLDPELTDKFGRLVQVGTFGSGQETPFEAIRLALSPPLIDTPMEQGGNGGFFRDRARLLVVVVTDEDDCSEIARPSTATVGSDPTRNWCYEQRANLVSVPEYHQIFTQEIKDGTEAAREIVWATIGPVGVTSKEVKEVIVDGQVRNIDCPTSYQPGFRQKEMAALFDSSLANLDSICKPSYRETLVAIAGLANISQVLELRSVPNPAMLQITIVRRDGSQTVCTMSNGGLVNWDEPSGDQLGRVHFGNQCLRRADDKELKIELLCAG
ncbi:MAG: VWA domain-containing protein [Myxococcales bacterium]|nr:VWA domain-containing protein [Myxococcales bacterium]